LSENRSVWLEVALNGAAGQAYQPLIPISVDQIVADGVACAKAGAAIVHVHAYTDDGQATEDVDIYSRIIEGIKSQCDAIVYPTLGLSGSIDERYGPIEVLAQRGLLDWSVVDPGSVNISHTSMVSGGADGLLYPNPDSHIRAGLQMAARDGLKPAYAIYEPGFARLGAAMAATVENLKTPIYRIMLSDNLLFGMKPSQRAIEFYAQHLAETAPGAPWMLSGLDAQVEQLIEPAVDLGAHIRVGLEDAPFGSQRSNLDLLESAVSIIGSAGRNLATAKEVQALS
jgi:uncharacterized protein (DUF849 family)